MNFTSLTYFEVLAQERSFTKAAQQLHLTQQSLSANIAKLEQELGCQLVVRRVPLELTYAGEVLLRYAATFREEYKMMQQEFCDISQNQRGVLRIGVTYTRGRTIMPAIIQAFLKEFPSIRVDLVEDTNDVLARKLANGEMDLAVANFPERIPGIVLREFYQEEMVVLVSRELLDSIYGDEVEERVRRFEEGDFAAIEDCPLVLNSIDDIGGHIERSLLKRAGVTHPRVMASASNVETLLALAVRGVGACFSPEILARASLSKKRLATLRMMRMGSMARYRISFGYQEQSYQWSVIESFMTVARETLRQ